MSLFDASEESSAPATPSSGRQVFYLKSDGFYRKNAAGVETKLIDTSGALGTPTSGDLRNCSLAVAPAIGGTTPNTGAFTTLSATGTISSSAVNSIALSNSAANINGTDATGTITLTNSSGGTYIQQFGPSHATRPNEMDITAASGIKLLNNTAITGIISATSLNLNKTITAAGTTGAQTINKATGTVNFAASAASLVVTNSLVDANSIINCTVGTNDATMKSAQAIAAAGSFTIYPNAVPTAETRVNFCLTN